MSRWEPIIHAGHLRRVAAVEAGHVMMMHQPDHDWPESCDMSGDLGWRAGRHMAERMSLHGREMEMLEQQQAITRSCPTGTCSGPADHPHYAPDHPGPESHHGQRARPAGHTLAAPPPAPRQCAQQHPPPPSSISYAGHGGSTCPSHVLPAWA
ncbi:hypothetical protein PIB30_095262 [Stylosanthes scabra]|uniref:Uncharacterized protein n=1 Tax=Stylosanthes scabra TaxID=79078 RepID=A0ABU6QW72_9FABA|nr:hypothetical protein [Stylosanthes scabra]